MEIIINLFLGILAVYFAIGFLFGIVFLFKAPKVDALMANTKKKVRFLLLPGVVSTWPFLIGRLFKSSNN